MNRKKATIYNVLFLVAAAAILIFLWMAPPETTKKVPFDQDHRPFYNMPKKEAEKQCTKCHSKEAGMPLPKDHPPKYRCLFCHKKNKSHS